VGTSTIGDPIGRSPVPPIRAPKAEPDRVMAGIAAVKAQAIYAPDPDTNKLARTKAGTFDRRTGRSTVEFCVDTRGRVATARTIKKFGDADVDRICRETVLGWRFKPFTVDGAARKTCSSVTFDLHFD
jgi:TonB family protein